MKTDDHLLLDVGRPDGNSVAVPALWLRQACGCSECRTSPLGQRIYELDELLAASDTLSAALREATAAGFAIDFVDGSGSKPHAGFVPHEAIRTAFGPPDRYATWPADRAWLTAEAVRADDPAMAKRVAQQIAGRGIALIRGVPVEAEQVIVVANQLGFVRDTNYGALFDVRSVPDPDNLAYSSAGLSPHTDNPYRDPCPTVQLLHCLRQAGSGGRSIFVDGFGFADEVRRLRPEDFAMLTSTAVAFQYCDDDVDLRAVGPIIDTNVGGEVTRVRVNNRSMVGPVGLDSAATVADFFGAYHRLVGGLHDGKAVVHLRLEPGDLIVFNNRRVLHGREQFELAPDDGDRWLQGCYIDLDAVLSTARRPAARR